MAATSKEEGEYGGIQRSQGLSSTGRSARNKKGLHNLPPHPFLVPNPAAASGQQLRGTQPRIATRTILPGEIQKGTGGRGWDTKCHKLSLQPLCDHEVSALERGHLNPHGAHAAHCDSPGEVGRLKGVSPKSAWPIRGAHSA